MRRFLNKINVQLIAFIIVGLACIYSVASVHGAQEADCRSNNQLRADLASVLRGAGDNERAQLAVINRIATPQERAKLAATFEPGLAGAITRVEKGIKEC
jgi:hypothetical protein